MLLKAKTQPRALPLSLENIPTLMIQYKSINEQKKKLEQEEKELKQKMINILEANKVDQFKGKEGSLTKTKASFNYAFISVSQLKDDMKEKAIELGLMKKKLKKSTWVLR